MASDFKLCLSTSGSPGLTSLDALTVPVSDPQASRPTADRVINGYGQAREQGAERFTWRYGTISLAEASQLESFCGEVYARSMNRLGGMSVYLAQMSFPVEMPPLLAGDYKELIISFDFAAEVI